jgi:hypothetical protein
MNNISPVLVNATRSKFGSAEVVIEEWRGKSSDTKPILKANRHGSTFYEMDTQEAFMFDGEILDWIQQ